MFFKTVVHFFPSPLSSFFPQRPTLHWTRGRGDTLWMKPQTLYRYFKPFSHILRWWIAQLTILTLNLLHHFDYFLISIYCLWQLLKPHNLRIFIFSHTHLLSLFSLSLSLSMVVSARGVWGQKGLLAPVGLLRWLAPSPSPLPSLCM